MHHVVSYLPDQDVWLSNLFDIEGRREIHGNMAVNLSLDCTKIMCQMSADMKGQWTNGPYEFEPYSTHLSTDDIVGEQV